MIRLNHLLTYQKINTLKLVFKSAGYRKNFIGLCVDEFLNKLFVCKKVNLTLPKLQLAAFCPIQINYLLIWEHFRGLQLSKYTILWS